MEKKRSVAIIFLGLFLVIRYSYSFIHEISYYFIKWDFHRGNMRPVCDADIPMMFDNDQAFHPDYYQVEKLAMDFISNFFSIGYFILGLIVWNIVTLANVWLFAFLFNKIKK